MLSIKSLKVVLRPVLSQLSFHDKIMFLLAWPLRKLDIFYTADLQNTNPIS